jgi:3-phenylpropionate/cinnamic acid dioxygenase small subunit
MIDARTLVETLNARYVAAIDDDRLEEWPAFFTDPCRYEIISAENVVQNLPLGVFFADSHAMLNDRVQSLRRANIFESQRYRHIVSATLVLGEEKNLVRAEANFLVVRIMIDGDMRLFMSGRYRDTVDMSGPAPLFREKRVIFDNRRIDTLLALPI